MEGITCKNCGATVQGNFCQHCGQKIIRDRWTMKKLFRSITNAVFNLEKGYFFTFKSLALNPGEVISNYLNGNTIKYSNPFRYALISITVSIFFILSLGVWELQMDQMIESYRSFGIINSDAEEANMRSTMGFVTKFMNFMPFLLLPFISLSSLLFLEKRKLHYAEHFILNAFMLGQSILYGILFSVLVYIFPSLISLQILLGFIIAGLVYSHIFKGMFDKAPIKGFILGFFIYLIGYIFFLITSGALAIITGLLMAIMGIVNK